MKRLALLFAVSLISGCAHTQDRRFVQGSQGRLYVDDGGSGSALPVLFIHGNGANLTQWQAQLDHLRRTRRAVAFELRGMGRSEPPANGDYSVAAMSDDIHAVADALDIRRFVIVGHSFGGSVVAAYAARHPERVAGVVFVDAAGSVQVSKEQAEQFLAGLRADKDRVVSKWFEPILKDASPEVKTAVLSSVAKTGVDAFARALQGVLDFDVKAALDLYRGPRLAIAAKPTEGPSSLHIQFPDVPVRTMDGVSHWLMMDRPGEFNSLMDEFLARIDG